MSVWGPADVGENTTVIEQLEPEFSVVPQVLEEIENCVPAVRATEEIDRLPVFVLERVIVFPAEVVPVAWLLNCIDAGDGIPQSVFPP